jgi:hypothetical protein
MNYMDKIIFSKIYNKSYEVLNNINASIIDDNKFKTDIVDLLFEIPSYNIVILIFISFLIYFVYSKLTIRLNDILIFLIIVLFFYVMLKVNSKIFYNFIKEKDVKLNFLHKLMFNTKNWTNNNTNNSLNVLPEGYFKKSYLYTNPNIIDLYYNVRDYSQYNIESYVNSLIHTNNVLRLSYESKNLKINEYGNYTIAINEMTKSLNEFTTFIYNAPLTGETYKKIESSIVVLRSLLTSELEDMNIVYKNNNKTRELNINSYPDDFYDINFLISPNDVKDVNYMPNYNIY